MSALARALPPGARLTRAAKWHVTLVFLGPAPVDEVAAILDDVSPGPPFSLRLTGAGNFGNAAWARVAGDLEKLGELRERVRAALAAGGFPADARPYQPHLTVSYRGDRAIRAALAGYAGAEWPVTEFALVDSHDGDYETVRTWPLQR